MCYLKILKMKFEIIFLAHATPHFISITPWIWVLICTCSYSFIHQAVRKVGRWGRRASPPAGVKNLFKALFVGHFSVLIIHFSIKLGTNSYVCMFLSVENSLSRYRKRKQETTVTEAPGRFQMSLLQLSETCLLTDITCIQFHLICK